MTAIRLSRRALAPFDAEVALAEGLKAFAKKLNQRTVGAAVGRWRSDSSGQRPVSSSLKDVSVRARGVARTCAVEQRLGMWRLCHQFDHPSASERTRFQST